MAVIILYILFICLTLAYLGLANVVMKHDSWIEVFRKERKEVIKRCDYAVQTVDALKQSVGIDKLYEKLEKMGGDSND